MSKKVDLKPRAMMYPSPAVIASAYDEEGKADACTLAFAAMCSHQPPAVMIAINSTAKRKTLKSILERNEFVIGFPTADQVAEADFIVRNPTHIACAMKYDAETMQSPTLTCKGTELIAKQIIEIAIKHDVPVIDNPPVARALFRMVELNQQIPPELYKAVAEILLFVYGLKAKK